VHTAPPPSLPERPEGGERRPRWPAWYAAAGFGVAFVLTQIALVVLFVATGEDADNISSGFTAGATLIQDVIFVGTAVFFASLTLRPRAWHFGLRRARFWPAVGWAALGWFCYFAISAVYVALVDPEVDQGITEALGADEGTFGLVVAGIMVVAVAPVAEEVFFRGFFYGALRSRFAVLPAALINGVLFGAIHYSPDAVAALPPLAVLGFVFCLIYEKTGSLFPVIALHAVNNAIAYGVQTEGDGTVVSLAAGLTVIIACAVVPRFMRLTGGPSAGGVATISRP
jgi:membrane protease YdiL (CAAX protease family)